MTLSGVPVVGQLQARPCAELGHPSIHERSSMVQISLERAEAAIHSGKGSVVKGVVSGTEEVRLRYTLAPSQRQENMSRGNIAQRAEWAAADFKSLAV